MPESRMPMTVVVVIPTYNERENLPVLLEQLLAQTDYRMLVVDDQSPDGTGDAADQIARRHPDRVEVMHRTGPKGFGRSYVDGFRRALHTDADLICQMDADLSHDPKYLPDLVAAADRADLVLGSRYLNGVSVVNWPLRRLILSSFANLYVRAITGIRAHDCTAGFRCWRRSTLERLPLDRLASDGYAFQVEMLFLSARQGARIAEVPIIFVERRQGSSKLSKSVIVESVFMPWRLILRHGGRVKPPAGGTPS
jgi:dolichol-phosphate mannosyltransferase